MAGGSPAHSGSTATEEPAGLLGDDDRPDVADAVEQTRERRWRWALLVVCAVALVLRLVYLFGWQAVDEIGGDAWYYHEAANLLADGDGFVHPYLLEVEGVRAPGADHPPGYSLVLAPFSLVGLDGLRDHQVVTCLIGTLTVGLMGLLGHRLMGGGRDGRRVGLLAAGFAAVYPNMWLNDPSLMTESLAMLAGVGFSVVAYRAWDLPSPARFAVAGAVLGLATLVRAEAALMFLLVMAPLSLWVPGLSGWRPRLGRLVVSGAVLALVLAPWVVPNLVRFNHPATVSTQLGPTLEVANCEATYYGDRIGGWTANCASELRPEPDGAVARYRDFGATRLEERPEVDDPYDRSELDLVTREVSFEYMGDNAGQVPFVLWARFGRAWGLYAPGQQMKIDRYTDARPYEAAWVGLGLYYVTAGAAVAGVIALRRRGVPSFPLTAWVVNVSLTVLLFYGTTRFRAPAEPALVLLGAVGVWWLWGLRSRSGSDDDDDDDDDGDVQDGGAGVDDGDADDARGGNGGRAAPGEQVTSAPHG